MDALPPVFPHTGQGPELLPLLVHLLILLPSLTPYQTSGGHICSYYNFSIVFLKIPVFIFVE